MDILAFMAVVVFGVLVTVFIIFKKDSNDLEPRTASLEIRTDNLEVNVDNLSSTTVQSLEYLRKMNTTIDVLTDGMTLVVPDDPIIVGGQAAAREEQAQQRRGRVGQEFHF